MGLNGLLDEIVECGFKVGCAFQLVGKLLQGLSHGGVEHDVGAGDGIGGAHHAELELVAGEGEGRGAVPVRGVPGELGQHVDAQLQDRFFRAAVGSVVFDGVQHGGELVAQEDGNDGGRRFVGAQTVIVAGGGYRQPQQILIVVYGLDGTAQEQQELSVLIGGVAGLEEVHAGVGGQRPVVVLAAAVDACKGLFSQQAHQTVAGGHLLHDLHGQLVVVSGHVGNREDGGQLMLGGSYLVVLRLGQDAQLPEFLVQVLHVGFHPGLDDAEIVVVQLLALGRLGTEQGPAAEHQVLPFFIHVLVHQEVFLLGTHAGADALNVLVAEELQNPEGLLVQGLHGPQQGGLFVQSLAAIGAESRGDAEGVALDEGVGGGVPGGVAAGLKGGAKTAGGEGRGVRLALDQLLAGELHDDAAVGRRGDEAVVLLGGDAGEGLEPVGEMGGAVLYGPVPHGGGHGVGHVGVQHGSLVNGLFQGIVNAGGQLSPHDTVIKNQTAKIIRYSCTHNEELLPESGGGVQPCRFITIEWAIKRKMASRSTCSKTPLPSMLGIIHAPFSVVKNLFQLF